MASRIALEVCRAISLAYFKPAHGVRYRGQKNIPEAGPVIVAPNHSTYYDAILVATGIKRRVRTMAWDALFRVPLLGPSIRWFGAFPVDAESYDAQAYKQCLRILLRGGALVIFPEGRRTMGTELAPFEPGVARLALRTGALIVPTTITGAFEAFPRWRKCPRPRWRIIVKFHRPIAPPKNVHLRGEELRQTVEALTEAIIRSIRRRYAAHLRLQRRRGRPLPAPPASS